MLRIDIEQFLKNFDAPAIAGIDCSAGDTNHIEAEQLVSSFLQRDLAKHLKQTTQPAFDDNKKPIMVSHHPLDVESSGRFSDDILTEFSSISDASVQVLEVSRNIQATVAYVFASGITSTLLVFARQCELLTALFLTAGTRLIQS